MVGRVQICIHTINAFKYIDILNFHIGLPMRLGFNVQRGYHIQVKKLDLFAIKGKKFKLKDLPSSFLSPQLNKTYLVFSTEGIVKLDQQGQNALREIFLMSNVIVDGKSLLIFNNVSL